MKKILTLFSTIAASVAIAQTQPRMTSEYAYNNYTGGVLYSTDSSVYNHNTQTVGVQIQNLLFPFLTVGAAPAVNIKADYLNSSHYEGKNAPPTSLYKTGTSLINAAGYLTNFNIVNTPPNATIKYSVTYDANNRIVSKRDSFFYQFGTQVFDYNYTYYPTNLIQTITRFSAGQVVLDSFEYTGNDLFRSYSRNNPTTNSAANVTTYYRNTSGQMDSVVFGGSSAPYTTLFRTQKYEYIRDAQGRPTVINEYNYSGFGDPTTSLYKIDTFTFSGSRVTPDTSHSWAYSTSLGMTHQTHWRKWNYNANNQLKEAITYTEDIAGGINKYNSSYRKFYYETVAVPNSISTESKALQFVVYPNPSNGIFSIEGTNLASISIYDIAGKQHGYTKSGNTIDISTLPHGTYWLKITDDKNATATQQIIKQ
jgi:hypothetical protein